MVNIENFQITTFNKMVELCSQNTVENSVRCVVKTTGTYSYAIVTDEELFMGNIEFQEHNGDLVTVVEHKKKCLRYIILKAETQLEAQITITPFNQVAQNKEVIAESSGEKSSNYKNAYKIILGLLLACFVCYIGYVMYKKCTKASNKALRPKLSLLSENQKSLIPENLGANNISPKMDFVNLEKMVST